MFKRTSRNTIILAALGGAILIGIIWFARPSPSATDKSAANDGDLTLSTQSFDFDTISMAAGSVKTAFTVQNQQSLPVTISRLYTSCMCTTATLRKNGQDFGPFGMQGHGSIPKINQSIAPGEEATVEVVFDPTAHGPAGVGRINRVVFVETSDGSPLEFKVSASVRP
ncbi:DUF1573 domain-containing protein [Candidatus Uhrbacteria bacterium]|nr:DUF1573 domain-containing protein [Candidatus Uhrbacteria bacterium]